MKEDYILLPAKPVLVFEVYLPDKPEYAPKLHEVLNAFLDLQELKAVPDIRKAISIGRTSSAFEEEKFLEGIIEVISGYSIYKADGRFRSSQGPINEKVQVIRFIIHDPLVEGGMRPELVDRSKEVIRYLITKRFAQEIGLEDEIWFIEYQSCWLQRWVNEEYRK